MTEPLNTLVMAAQQGDREAFGRIVLRFQDMAYAGAYTLVGDPDLAQDVAQEAFIDAYLNLPKLREPAAFPGWFRRVILKHSDRQRRGKTPETVPLDAALAMPSSQPDPATLAEKSQTAQTVHEVITTLSEPQQMVITLFYI